MTTAKQSLIWSMSHVACMLKDSLSFYKSKYMKKKSYLKILDLLES